MSSADIGSIDRPVKRGNDAITGSALNSASHTPVTRTSQPGSTSAISRSGMAETSTFM